MEGNSIQSQIQILTGAVGLLMVVVGVAATYLRLYMAKELNRTKDSIIQEVKSEFARKETLDIQLREYERRITRLETFSTVAKVIDGPAK